MANYSVSTYTSQEGGSDSVLGGTLPAFVILTITPDVNYVVSASDFQIGDALPSEVASVTFADTTEAGTPDNEVSVLVIFEMQEALRKLSQLAQPN